MEDTDFNFLTNNVKGMQSTKKRLKQFEYFKNKLDPKGVMFLQETHSISETELKWKDEFGGQCFFSHGTSNSCGVLIAFHGIEKFSINKKFSDNKGRMLILDALIGDSNFIFINLYNANSESEQIKVLEELTLLLSQFDLTKNQKIILAGDFNVFFDATLDAKGGNPKLKQHSVSKILEIKENLDLCDIWRVQNPKKTHYTFHQKHFSGLIQRRLDYIFVSQNIQENIRNSKILCSISTDHSPAFCSILTDSEFAIGKGLWKFNDSLIFDKGFMNKMKKFIQDTTMEISSENLLDEQTKWEFLKYEIRKFAIKFSKNLAKEKKIERCKLEQKLKFLENNPSSTLNLDEYYKTKDDLELIYDNIAEGVKVRSKCQWYENGEKSTKFFLNLEKKNAVTSLVKRLEVVEKKSTIKLT